jgi:4-hydroxyphenylacetate 3-monooxygenase
MLKTGQQHVESLRDGRAVFIEGERVSDVTTHPAFRNAVASIATLFDFQCLPENRDLVSYVAENGERVARAWQLPTSYAALVDRRKGLEAVADLHYGFLNRTPDYVASGISAMVMGIDVFEAYDRKRAGALVDYYRYARDRNLYLNYVITNPQADRSKSAGRQAREFFTAGMVDQDHEGITVRGAKMLATGATLANEVFVTCIQPLQPGDEKQALSFAIPLGTKGVKLLSRKSYEQHAPSMFDNPLSSRFDENDAVLYFDDVKVPWERVFIAGSIEMCARQFQATPAHVYQNYQSMVRLNAKLRFLLGVARRIADINGTTDFSLVRETLGQLAAEVAAVESMMLAMEVKGVPYGIYFVPDRHILYAAQTLTQQLYPRLVTTLRELAGGSMIMLPSSVRDFANPEIADLIDKTQQSPAASALDKVKFYKLAWDAVGSEFASRHTHYEMFYSGAPFVNKGHSFRTYDWDRATAMIDRFLATYELADEVKIGR